MAKILYVNDVHFCGNSEPHYPKTAEILPKFFEYLIGNEDGIDMMLIGGDCVNAGSANIEQLKIFKQAVDAAGIPYYAIAGNHDIAPSYQYAAMYPGMEDIEDVPIEQTNFAKLFGLNGIRCSFDLGSLAIIGFSIRDFDYEAQLDWLVSELGKPGKKLVFGHYPLIPSRQGGFCEDWGYSRIAGVLESLKELIFSEKSNVLAYFCGHQHINSRVRLNHTEQISTGAVGLATCCYRVLEIQDNLISISTDKFDCLNWLDDVMCPEISSDTGHPALTSYHWGNQNEREFILNF